MLTSADFPKIHFTTDVLIGMLQTLLNNYFKECFQVITAVTNQIAFNFLSDKLDH